MKVYVVYDPTMEEVVKIFDDEDVANKFCSKYNFEQNSKYVYVEEHDLVITRSCC